MLENMLTGLIYTFRWDMLLAVFTGVVGWMVVGGLPGLSTTMGVALQIPITFGMTPAVGLRRCSEGCTLPPSIADRYPPSC